MLRLASLPKPKETEWELELPEERQETSGEVELSAEDAAERDRRNQVLREAAEAAEFSRRTQVLQRGLPRPLIIDVEAMMKTASTNPDASEKAVAQEMALLIANDSFKYPAPGARIQGPSRLIEAFDDDALAKARLEIALGMQKDDRSKDQDGFESAWAEFHESSSALPGLSVYGKDDVDQHQVVTEAFNVSTAFKDCQKSYDDHELR